MNGKEVGEDVAVIGGGLTGCEIAYELCLEGKNPAIIEAKSDLIAQTGVCLANSSYLREYFALHKVPVYLNSKVVEIKDNVVVVLDENNVEHDIKADSTIVSVGYIPTPLTKKDRNVYLVGDCDKVGNLRTVIWKAYEVAMKI